jgi:NAD(P)-dependent dehydrogenase (short-subunit alcohol dehydrogenase family)
MPKEIRDQVIVITGASSGIGLATAQEAARRGARVVLAARNAADLARHAADINRAGGHALDCPTDVTDPVQVEQLANRAVTEFGRIDTWINNAAVAAYACFEDQPLDDFRRIMEVNFMGQVYGARAALPHLEKAHGALICMGSALSDRGVPLQGAYCAAKHALKGWLDSLRVELQSRGSPVRVTLIKPSSINTPLFNKARTQLGVMPRPLAPVYDVRIAVDAILRAAEGNYRDIFVGGAGWFFSRVESVSPALLDRHQRTRGTRGQLSSRPKSAEGPHNLYEALEDDGGINGDWLHESHQHSTYQTASHHRGLLMLGLAAAGAAAFFRARRNG